MIFLASRALFNKVTGVKNTFPSFHHSVPVLSLFGEQKYESLEMSLGVDNFVLLLLILKNCHQQVAANARNLHHHIWLYSDKRALRRNWLRSYAARGCLKLRMSFPEMSCLLHASCCTSHCPYNSLNYNFVTPNVRTSVHLPHPS